MIRSIRLLVFASVLTMAHGVLAEERIGIRSHSLGWLRGLDNAHVLVVKITEHGKTCGMTKNIAEKEFVSGIRAIPATTYKEGDEVDNIFVLSINTIYRKEIGWCTSNLAVNFFHNSAFYHAGLDEIVPGAIQLWFGEIIFDSLRKDHANTLKKVISMVVDAFDKSWTRDNAPETAGRRMRSRGIIPPHPRAESMAKKFGKPAGGLTGKDLR